MLAELREGFGLGPEELVGPEDVGFFASRRGEEVAVEAVDVRANGGAVHDLGDQGVLRNVARVSTGMDGVAEALERPEAVEGGVVRGDGSGVEDLHGRVGSSACA